MGREYRQIEIKQRSSRRQVKRQNKIKYNKAVKGTMTTYNVIIFIHLCKIIYRFIYTHPDIKKNIFPIVGVKSRHIPVK